MLWDSNIIKLIAAIGILMVAALIWTTVLYIKREKEFFIGLTLLLCLGVVPPILVRGHTAKPVISTCLTLADGRLQVKDSTRHCYEVEDSSQVFIAILEPGSQLALFETCTICHKTLFDHQTKQYTDAQMHANSILASAPWE